MTDSKRQDPRADKLDYILIGETFNEVTGEMGDLKVVADLEGRTHGDNFKIFKRPGQQGRDPRPSATKVIQLYQDGKIDFAEGGKEAFLDAMAKLRRDPDAPPSAVGSGQGRQARAAAEPAPIEGLESMTRDELSDRIAKPLGIPRYAPNGKGKSRLKSKAAFMEDIRAYFAAGGLLPHEGLSADAMEAIRTDGGIGEVGFAEEGQPLAPAGTASAGGNAAAQPQAGLESLTKRKLGDLCKALGISIYSHSKEKNKAQRIDSIREYLANGGLVPDDGLTEEQRHAIEIDDSAAAGRASDAAADGTRETPATVLSMPDDMPDGVTDDVAGQDVQVATEPEEEDAGETAWPTGVPADVPMEQEQATAPEPEPEGSGAAPVPSGASGIVTEAPGASGRADFGFDDDSPTADKDDAADTGVLHDIETEATVDEGHAWSGETRLETAQSVTDEEQDWEADELELSDAWVTAGRVEMPADDGEDDASEPVLTWTEAANADDDEDIEGTSGLVPEEDVNDSDTLFSFDDIGEAPLDGDEPQGDAVSDSPHTSVIAIEDDLAVDTEPADDATTTHEDVFGTSDAEGGEWADDAPTMDFDIVDVTNGTIAENVRIDEQVASDSEPATTDGDEADSPMIDDLGDWQEYVTVPDDGNESQDVPQDEGGTIAWSDEDDDVYGAAVPAEASNATSYGEPIEYDGEDDEDLLSFLHASEAHAVDAAADANLPADEEWLLEDKTEDMAVAEVAANDSEDGFAYGIADTNGATSGGSSPAFVAGTAVDDAEDAPNDIDDDLTDELLAWATQGDGSLGEPTDADADEGVANASVEDGEPNGEAGDFSGGMASDEISAGLDAGIGDDIAEEGETEEQDPLAGRIPSFLPRRRRVPRRRKATDTGSMPSLANRISLNGSEGEQLMGNAGQKEAPNEGSAVPDILFAPGVGIDYDNPDEYADFQSASASEGDDILSGAVTDETEQRYDDNDDILIMDDDDEPIDIFDDLDQEGIRTQDDLMEAILPPDQDAVLADDGTVLGNYSGFEFAWSDKAADGYGIVDSAVGLEFSSESNQPGSREYVPTDTGEDEDGPYPNEWNDADMAVSASGDAEGASDAFASVWDEAGTSADVTYGEPEQGAAATDPVPEAAALFSDGYPMSDGVGRGMSAGDREKMRNTFLRMIVEVGVIALIAVIGILFVLMSH